MTEPDPSGGTGADHARIARQIMRRQAGLSLKVAAVFLAMLLGLPLLNRFAPGIARYSVLGFPANWLFLAVLFYPITVALSVVFVRASDRIEEESKGLFRAPGGEAGR